jgi:hypothetical protein
MINRKMVNHHKKLCTTVLTVPQVSEFRPELDSFRYPSSPMQLKLRPDSFLVQQTEKLLVSAVLKRLSEFLWIGKSLENNDFFSSDRVSCQTKKENLFHWFRTAILLANAITSVPALVKGTFSYIATRKQASQPFVITAGPPATDKSTPLPNPSTFLLVYVSTLLLSNVVIFISQNWGVLP